MNAHVSSASPQHPKPRLGEVARRHVGMFTASILGLVILSPWLWGTGFMLHYDLVFVPHLALSASTAGLDGDVPRAVPNDLVVALFDVVLPGWLVERFVLFGVFVAVGMGVDRLRVSGVARFAAAAALSWNPWVGERLAIGHWGYLWGYAGVVWVIVGALDFRADGGRRGVLTFTVGMVLASLSGSTGGVLAALAGLILMAWPGAGRPRLRSIAVGACWWLALNAAWWFPFLTLAPSGTADARGVSAFAARADSPAGLWASLLSGGAIWNQANWFSARDSGPLVVGVALLACVGVGVLTRRTRERAGWSVLVLACVGLVLSGAAAVEGADGVVKWIVLHVPGGGLLRDSQKFVALWVVPAALGLGIGVEALRRRGAGTLLAPLSVAAALVVPVATLPNLAGSDHGRWGQAHYPAEFQEVAKQVRGEHGAVAAFPWQLYRRYAWNGQQVTLDPWQRLVPNRVLVDDDLPLNDGVVRGENGTSHRVTADLARGDSRAVASTLRAAGVRYVIEQKDQPPGAGRAPNIGTVVHDGPLLQLRDLGAFPTTSDGGGVPWWGGTGLALTGGALVAWLIWATRRRSGTSRENGASLITSGLQ